VADDAGLRFLLDELRRRGKPGRVFDADKFGDFVLARHHSQFLKLPRGRQDATLERPDGPIVMLSGAIEALAHFAEVLTTFFEAIVEFPAQVADLPGVFSQRLLPPTMLDRPQ